MPATTSLLFLVQIKIHACVLLQQGERYTKDGGRACVCRVYCLFFVCIPALYFSVLFFCSRGLLSGFLALLVGLCWWTLEPYRSSSRRARRTRTLLASWVEGSGRTAAGSSVGIDQEQPLVVGASCRAAWWVSVLCVSHQNFKPETDGQVDIESFSSVVLVQYYCCSVVPVPKIQNCVFVCLNK